jgi:uncharacterized UBP type Zn finger protein
MEIAAYKTDTLIYMSKPTIATNVYGLLICGHVGCCDSSIGLHATKHFERTGHPVMIALPNKSWKWCYVHKQYS